MVNELEPRSTGEGNNNPYSAEDQLNVFRSQLDEIASPRGLLSLPGFLFRNGKEHSRIFSPRQLEALRMNDTSYLRYMLDVDFGLAVVNEGDLIAAHAETYKRALEARDLLLERIRPVEILEMVRDTWGGGSIRQTEGGGILSGSYLKVVEEIVTVKLHSWGPHRIGPEWYLGGSTSSNVKTGKWYAVPELTFKEVGVYFGNAEFLDGRHFTVDLHGRYSRGAAIRKFFADELSEETLSGSWGHRLPDKIWRSPDNLGILVDGNRWFDQSVSQQEIMDYLAQELEAQRSFGRLPHQLKALALAKIEELRKRGLFVEGQPI